MSEPTDPDRPAWPAETTTPDIPRRAAPSSPDASAISADLGEAATQIAEAISSGPRTLEQPAVAPEPPSERDLAALERAAVAVQPRAYAPYSRFQVGAALWGEGQQFLGVNVENASFGLTICAERNAVAHAATAGVRQLSAIAVCTSASPPSSPCGSCRQVLAELAEDPRTFRVIAVNPEGERREWTLEQLLPDCFTRSELPGQTQ